MDKNFETEIKKAEKCVEKILNVKIDDLKLARKFMYDTFKDVFVVPNYKDVIHNSIKAKTTDELGTTVEKCIKRCDNIHRLNELCESGKACINDTELKKAVAIYSHLWSILDNYVIFAEMIYFIEAEIDKENTKYNKKLMEIYEYWKNICTIYLTETEAFEVLLEDYMSSQENKPKI